MQHSKKIYYLVPYEQTLKAKVFSITSYKNSSAIILDQTLFYPEGGGQMGDRGFIEGLEIFDTQIDKEGFIYHLTKNECDFKIGQEVTLKLDWQHRYDFMQQHSSQHLLSGTLHRLFGIGTVSVHLGHDDFSIEIDSQEISEAQLEKLEEVVNYAVLANEEISSSFVTKTEFDKLNLRREAKVDDDIRLIHIGSFDSIACGGLHVQKTGELRYIKYLRSEKIRGNLKLFWVGGNRAVSLINSDRKIVDSLGSLLSSPKEKIVENFLLMQRQLVDARYHLNRKRVEVASFRLNEEFNRRDRFGEIKTAIFDASDWEEEDYKNLAEVFLKLDSFALAVCRNQGDSKLVWMIAYKGLSIKKSFFDIIKEEALCLIEAKGGGKEPLFQGIGNNRENKELFLQKVNEIFLRELNEK
jgi:alanyl-tRNA synthetase